MSHVLEIVTPKKDRTYEIYYYQYMLSSHLKSICFLAFSGIWWTHFNVFGDATWGLLSNVEKHGEINGCRKKKTWTSNGPNTFLCVRIGRLLTHFDSFPSSETSTIPGFKPPKIRNGASMRQLFSASPWIEDRGLLSAPGAAASCQLECGILREYAFKYPKQQKKNWMNAGLSLGLPK